MDRQTKGALTDGELERALRIQRRAVARARMRRIRADLSDCEGLPEAAREPVCFRLTPAEHWQPREETTQVAQTAPIERQAAAKPVRRPTTAFDRMLLAVEVLALIGVVAAAILSLGDLQRLRRDLFMPEPAASPTAVPAAPIAWLEPTFTPSPTFTVTPTPTRPPTEVLLPGVRTTPTATPTMTATRERPNTPTLPPMPTGTPDSPTGVRFVIPAIGVDAPMVEGDDWETLKTGIGHRIGSAWPGQNGNVVVSAHNDVHGAIFKNLRELQPGDLVYAYTPAGIFRYEVVFTRLVLPTEVSVMSPTRQPILTMITCYPPFMDTHRIVVTARLVD